MRLNRRQLLRSFAGVVPLVAPARTPAAQMYWAGTPQPVVEAMLDLAQVTASDVVYDLGSGDRTA